MDQQKVLILCTGNSCRSQMAEGFMRQMAPDWKVRSAGTQPAAKVHPMAAYVMGEEGIDLSNHTPQKVQMYLAHPWDLVITVCGGAQESCPSFSGEVGQRLHLGFEDPSALSGTEAECLDGFRQIRNQIKAAVTDLVAKRS